MRQLGLFGAGDTNGDDDDDNNKRPTVVVEPHLVDEDRELAARVPRFIRFGTSSWSFPGWNGIVYAGRPSENDLARGGLAAYAQQPLLRTVSIDRSYYGPLRTEDIARYRAQLDTARSRVAVELPPFRVLSKVWDEITTAIFPKHPRYGARAGARNPFFLDTERFQSEVLAPYTIVEKELSESWASRDAGPFLFELTPMPQGAMDERAFVARVDDFISRLPSGHRWAFELRNAELFGTRWLDMLRANRAAHVFTFWTAMPPLQMQLRARALTAPFTVVRLMLPPYTRYASRKEDFAPFDKIAEPQTEMRDDVVDILRAAADAGCDEGFVLVNNKAEGSAPLTVRALAKKTAIAFCLTFAACAVMSCHPSPAAENTTAKPLPQSHASTSDAASTATAAINLSPEAIKLGHDLTAIGKKLEATRASGCQDQCCIGETEEASGGARWLRGGVGGAKPVPRQELRAIVSDRTQSPAARAYAAEWLEFDDNPQEHVDAIATALDDTRPVVVATILPSQSGKRCESVRWQDQTVSKEALGALRHITGNRFADAEAFTAWRKEHASAEADASYWDAHSERIGELRTKNPAFWVRILATSSSRGSVPPAEIASVAKTTYTQDALLGVLDDPDTWAEAKRSTEHRGRAVMFFAENADALFDASATPRLRQAWERGLLDPARVGHLVALAKLAIAVSKRATTPKDAADVLERTYAKNDDYARAFLLGALARDHFDAARARIEVAFRPPSSTLSIVDTRVQVLRAIGDGGAASKPKLKWLVTKAAREVLEEQAPELVEATTRIDPGYAGPPRREVESQPLKNESADAATKRQAAVSATRKRAVDAIVARSKSW